MQLTFCAPGKILFGPGALEKLPGVLSGCRRVWVVTGPSAVRLGTAGTVTDCLERSGVVCEVYDAVHGEPTVEMIREARAIGSAFMPDAVVGLGGGSAVDAGKALSGLLTNEGDIVDYLEGVGCGRVMSRAPLPCVALPTTAGTGAECTKNAVIADWAAQYKRSFRDDRLMPDAALVDPVLGVSVPAKTTAYAGMDALTQLIEAYLSKKANPMTDSLAIGAVGAAFAALPRACADGGDVQARTDMAYGAMISGLCLANAGLGAAHGVAASLGAVAGVPHGLACAVLLPHVLAYNAPHCAQKTCELAARVTGRSFARAEDAAQALNDALAALMANIGIPEKISAPGLTREKMPALEKGVSGSSMGGNPVPMEKEQVRALLERVIAWA
ncbi:MAG: iron-containing alcohol dehydrogenase [Eubacteriales bacterium]|nr:iron-containing alcohol dehydrogenase [Eubacteriales bacterium]